MRPLVLLLLLVGPFALAVQTGQQPLLNFLNAGVTAHKADRWLNATRDYWFESLDWADRVRR